MRFYFGSRPSPHLASATVAGSLALLLLGAGATTAVAAQKPPRAPAATPAPAAPTQPPAAPEAAPPPVAVTSVPSPTPPVAPTPEAKAEAIRLREIAVREFRADADVKKARRRLFEALALDPQPARIYYELGLLAESQRQWAEAGIWFDQFLDRERDTELAEKIRQEVRYLNWAMAYDATMAGQSAKDSRKSEEAARTALSEGDWQRVSDQARAALKANPDNIDAGLLLAAAEIQLGHRAFADMGLRMLLTRAPEDRKPVIEQAIAQNEVERAFVEKRMTADALFAQKKRGEAGDAYAALWAAYPTRYDLIISALESYVLGESYTKAIALVHKLAAAAPAPETLPPGLRDLPAVTMQLAKLSAYAGGGGASSRGGGGGGSSKSTGKSSAPAKPKSMADDFLSRLKKK